MFQFQSIENVVLLQEAEISILSAVQLIVQPGGSCFLGANAFRRDNADQLIWSGAMPFTRSSMALTCARKGSN